MSVLFDRKVKVTLASNLGSVSFDSAGRFFNAFTRSTNIEDLRVSFTIEKSLMREPNSCKFVINNLAKDTRAEFQSLPAHVSLSAGYGSDIKELFKGDIIHGASRHDAPEWLTEVQCGTGATSFKHGRVSKSFRVGTDVRTLIKEVASGMGLKVPGSVDGAKEFLTQLKSGISLDGLSAKEMTRILKPRGFSFSVQDDQLQIIKTDELNRAEAIIVSADHGMIGSPELGTPESKGKSPILKVRMLLEPFLIPGGLIQLRARNIQGNFKLLRVIHTGDTHGQSWYSDLEARPI